MLIQKYFKTTDFIILLLLVFSAIHFKPWHKTYIVGDGVSYYSYLPSLFIYFDNDYTFLEDVYAKHYKHFGRHNFTHNVQGAVVNKGYLGTSILLLPFFILAHVYALIFNQLADGYSLTYQYSTLIAAIFWMWLGLLCLRKILESYGINNFAIGVTLFVIAFTTPLLHYTAINSTYSHVYSFSLITILMYFIRTFFLTNKIKYIWLSAICLGLIGLVRPTNGLVVFLIPAMANGFKDIKKAVEIFNKNRHVFIGGVLIVLIILSLQPLYYLVQTGNLFVWSYQGESFNFSKPQIVDYLFSYNNGLFVYSPSLLLVFFGIPSLYKKYPLYLTFSLIFLFLIIYVLSSWWCWWYGMSFGQRSFVDFLGVLAIYIAFGLNGIKHIFSKILISILCIVIIGFTYVQMKQYLHFVFPLNMDRAKYWRVFLRDSREWHGIYWRENRTAQKIDQLKKDFQNILVDLNYSFEDSSLVNSQYNVDKNARSGSRSIEIKEETKLIELINLKIPEVAVSNNNVIVAQLFCYPIFDPLTNNFIIQLEISRNNEVIFVVIKNAKSSDCFRGKWSSFSFAIEKLPELEPNDCIKIILHNPEKNIIYFDDVSLQILY